MTLPLIGCCDLYVAYQDFTKMGFRCDENSKTVTSAKALGPERLFRLYADARDLLKSTTIPAGHYRVVIDPVPEQFKDLEPVSVRVMSENFADNSPEDVRLMLNWCFDHIVDLQVKSIGQPVPYIILLWGEGPTAGEAVLWRRVEE